MRFRRSVKLAPGLRLNFSGSGVSLSAGPRGASVSFGKRGTYLNTGIPGTGLYSRTRQDVLRANAVRPYACPKGDLESGRRRLEWNGTDLTFAIVKTGTVRSSCDYYNYFVFATTPPALIRLKQNLDELQAADPVHQRIDALCVLNKGVIANLRVDGKIDALSEPGFMTLA